MLKKLFLDKVDITKRIALTSIILIVNVFIWYSYAFTILKQITNEIELTYFETLMMWAINFIGATVSALVGACITSKLDKRVSFLEFWMFLGTVSSLLPLLLGTTTLTSVLIIFLLFGISFGLGMPACMAYYADWTTTENRARVGGIIFLMIGSGSLLLNLLRISNSVSRILILSIWRGLGLLCLFFSKPHEVGTKKRQSVSYSLIISQRSFLLYFIPWLMFCLVNYTSVNVIIKFFGEDFVRFSTMVEGSLIGVFALVGGFFSDIVGRKRVTITGFAMLGLGYAVLGIYPESLSSWYFYTVVDGVAWGAFYTLFFITLWGDLAHDTPSDKYYALGGLPFLSSSFLQLIGGPLISKRISVYTIFSLASLFLFLSVLPLMFAPETLPEKKIKERELKKYIEKARKIKEKYD